jgi:hypothetical protein
MMRALRWPGLAVGLLAALIAATAVTRPDAATSETRRSSSQPVTTTDLVCPNVGGTDTSPTTLTVANVSAELPGGERRTARIRTTPLTGPRAKTQTLPTRAVNRVAVKSLTPAMLIEADGPGAGAVIADQSRLISRGVLRSLFSAPCLAPATDWWITGAEGRVGYTDALVLANPGRTVVNLTVSVWSTKGPIEPPKLQSYTVDPRSSQLLMLSDYAPDGALLTLHVHANSGRLVAQVLDRRVTGIEPAGLDWIPPTQPPATDLVIPGYLGGPGPRHLVLCAPGDRDATVNLRLATTSGNFAPAGRQTVVVRAGHAVDVRLTSTFANSPGSVVLHSDQPVTAAGLSSAGLVSDRDHPDIQWQPAGLPLTGPAVLAANEPPFDRTARVYATAPEAAAAVRVTPVGGPSRLLKIPAGRTLSWDPEAALSDAAYGPLVFTPVRGGPVYVSRSLFAYGVHGPLVTSEQPALLPSAINLPAAVRDDRVAARGR